MPEYKRLVSYMYNYEDGVKRNNVGYARVEARNGQCKFTLHITAPSLNEKQLKVYVFKRKADGMEGVLLGVFQVRNGVGDFKTITDSLHIMNSPHGLQDMGGIVLYLNERKYFATEWDDVPVTMSMVTGMVEAKPVSEEKSMKAANVAAVLEEPPVTEEKSLEQETESQQVTADKSLVPDETAENKTEANLKDNLKDLLNPSFEHLLDRRPEDNVLGTIDPVIKDKQKEPPSSNVSKVGNINDYKLRKETPAQNREQSKVTPETPSVMPSDAKEPSLEKPQTPVDKKKEEAQEKLTQEKEAVQEDNVQENTSVHKDTELEESAPQVEGDLGQESKPFFDDHPLAKQIYRTFPRMYPFEDNEVAWCVRIEPKDIGLLPMESWILGNNSFLLHGYYSYRHLIFARINDKNGMNYILGVPGIYHNREKFMAKMFGFENFKCAKRKAQRTGEFGYWFVPVLLN
ncbi:hypothetical protein acsn021_44360 [Anaerocolumna cellulosilytica]|uniref:Uncharacterized protein n=1 Tax=Anaerocolumna cellulosilytica TaxID=433286 RepID=A0A6S6R9P3_9FIRM|nr:DUF6128 domain-containing protein [Anaerocolumna cellulosilytica]MBB5195857.1 hypothetical protein [Anaerocolumna cellulosilytica]BCJ96867.1 hypothetical protein acsn021_44360 [Anaerocolumna cellulosilytica]